MYLFEFWIEGIFHISTGNFHSRCINPAGNEDSISSYGAVSDLMADGKWI